jgi:hypothetical protein
MPAWPSCSHGITKQASEVPPREIDLAIRRKKPFAACPDRHTYGETE